MHAPKSPPLRILLGVLIIDATVSVAVLVWNGAEMAMERLARR